MTSLTSLPPELFACILDCVPSIDLQQTAISLLRITSYGLIPNWRRYLFYHIHLKSENNVRALSEHLQRTPGDADFIKKFSLATWSADADAAINVILMIPELEWLSLCIGMNFAPEHLRRLFHKPMTNLRYLSLQYRPYVSESEAMCNPYLRNTYYGSVLEILASWPSAELSAISVVQDPLHPILSSEQSPNFFDLRLDNLSDLASSPLLARTHALRLRIPGHKFVHSLRPSRWRPALPHIAFLDLSASRISNSDVRKLLHSLPRLRHLVLDSCGLPDDWVAFARQCMFASKDLSLEQQVNRRLVALGGVFVPGEKSRPRKVRILPRASALRTLSLSVPAHVDADAQRVLVAAFRRGWGEAVAALNEIVAAARRSRAEEGVLTLRFPSPGEAGDALQEYGFLGMVVVEDDGEFTRLSEVRDVEDCPVLCLAGQKKRKKAIEHAEGCGHSVGSDIWEDNL